MRRHRRQHMVRQVQRRQDDGARKARPAQIVAETAGAAALGLVAHDPPRELHGPADQQHGGTSKGVHGVQQRRAEEQRVG